MTEMTMRIESDARRDRIVRIIESVRRTATFPWTSGSQDKLDNSWRTLEFVLTLIKHAETKAIATLAAAGVVGQILFTVVHSGGEKARAVVLISAGLCTVFVTVAGCMAVCVLWPRLKSGDPTVNLLYFRDLTNRCITREAYIRAVAGPGRRQDDVIEQLAAQIWANAIVARNKYRFANIAVGCLLVAVLALAVTASISAILARS
ncbi:Pycsar system effector family protein [Nocardia brasiliensis]|uniref:Pycsar system effector family protein n=1 Tax=Nocardia brasiliensis TaxID=37326 RepID=UPI0033CD583C